MVSTREVVAGRYALEREIGRGGMGTVWRAHDELLGRPVAAKEVLPPPELAAPARAQLLEQTVREARSAARIHSRSAVTVHDVVEHEGRPWIVMELLDATSLGQVLREQGPLAHERVAAVGLAVLDALDAAHAAGVVHRDVKPANVLLCRDGRTVLTDFGLAVLDGEATPTTPGTVLGSPAFMAPERLRGAAPSPAMDLWSLGATLWTAAAGVSPFTRSDLVATVRAVTADPLPDLPVPAGPLADALQGLLRRDPHERLDSEATRTLLAAAGTPVPLAAATPRPPTAAQALPPASRGRARRRRVLAGALVALVAGGVALVERGRHTPAPAAAPAAAPAPVPAATRTYRDPTGFALDVPAGWAATPRGAQVEFREPGGQRFLAVSRNDPAAGGPVSGWRQQEPYVAARLPGYHLLGIRGLTLPGRPAADWDFTWQSPSGPLRVRDRAVVLAPGRGYALYFSVPASDDAASLSVLGTATASLRAG